MLEFTRLNCRFHATVEKQFGVHSDSLGVQQSAFQSVTDLGDQPGFLITAEVISFCSYSAPLTHQMDAIVAQRIARPQIDCVCRLYLHGNEQSSDAKPDSVPLATGALPLALVGAGADPY